MRSTSLLLPVLVLSGGLAAQAVPVSPTYRAGMLTSEWQACSPTGMSFRSSAATFTLDGAGGLSFTFADTLLCPGGVVSNESGSGSGGYTANTDGTMTFDFDMANPGEDIDIFLMRGDGSFGATGRHECVSEGSLGVAIGLSSGQSNASLQGEYHVIRLVGSNRVAQPTVSLSELGVIAFDGAGSFTESGRRNALPAGGTTTSQGYADAGTYTVAPDGSLTAGPGTSGAVTSDHVAFFWVHDDAASGEVSLTIGVEKGIDYTEMRALGEYRYAQLVHEVGGTSDRIVTEFGDVVSSATGVSAGMLDTDAMSVATSSTLAQQCGNRTENIVYSVSTDGLLTFGTFPAPPRGALAADGSIVLVVDDLPEATGALVAVAACESPRILLPGTPGTAGETPMLSVSGGAPRIGNNEFAYEISSALPGSVGVLWVTLGASAPVMLLGGVFHINAPLTIGTTILPISATGNATFALPILRRPAWVGSDVAAQMFVLDSGAPRGFAMSPGLEYRICR